MSKEILPSNLRFGSDTAPLILVKLLLLGDGEIIDETEPLLELLLGSPRPVGSSVREIFSNHP